MTPIALIYWLRVALGVVAGALSTVLALALNNTEITTFLNCLTIALLVYLISYYVFKAKFKNAIEKQSKIMTTGIGVFFFTWLTFLVLFYTIARTIIPL